MFLELLGLRHAGLTMTFSLRRALALYTNIFGQKNVVPTVQFSIQVKAPQIICVIISHSITIESNEAINQNVNENSPQRIF